MVFVSMQSMSSTSSSAHKLAPRGKPASQADIHQRVYNAIVEYRLLPGTKLAEERVAELFHVSRTQVRGALQRLAVEQLVTLIPNRGAFVTTPTAEEAHDVLETRRSMEPAVVRRLTARIAEGAQPTAIAQLRAHTDREAEAHAKGDRRMVLRLSGDFHVLLAELSGSGIMARMMRAMTPLTCLAILTFDAPMAAACPNDEHSRLIEAIEAGESDAAAALMVEHLHHIEHSLRLGRLPADDEHDLAAALFG